ncbi:MAG: FadR family transcriptional regulator [Chloroflexi bacterium]|nr:FadR family transcriptional regulator [Chloroflexota bacterium]
MNNDSLEPVIESSLNDIIQNRLKNYIIQNKLRPGERMPTEEYMAENLGVSRTAIREALRSLEALGIIEARQGFGRVVCEFNFNAILRNLSYGLAFQNHTILQVTEIRKALDAYFIEMAIQNISAEDIAELFAIVEQMREHSAKNLNIADEDYAFHALLYRRCGNPLAFQLFEIAWDVRLNAIDRAAAIEEIPPGTSLEHQAIVEAIQAKNVAEARKLILAHYWNSEQRFRRQIEREQLRVQLADRKSEMENSSAGKRT